MTTLKEGEFGQPLGAIMFSLAAALFVCLGFMWGGTSTERRLRTDCVCGSTAEETER
jgi:hypothetical protein